MAWAAAVVAWVLLAAIWYFDLGGRGARGLRHGGHVLGMLVGDVGRTLRGSKGLLGRRIAIGLGGGGLGRGRVMLDFGRRRAWRR